MESLKRIYLEAQRRLREAGVDDPALNAARIIEKHTGVRRFEIVLSDKFSFRDGAGAFWNDVGRRCRREPLQYICGIWPFYGLDFFVGDGVLIPRPDTEVLVKTAADFLAGRGAPSFLELCAGSGCVTAAVLKTVPESTAVCVELSDKAAVYLKKNLEFHGLAYRAQTVTADVLDKSTSRTLSGPFDALLCNPPYIKTGDLRGLEPEVARYEPSLALDGGPDGLKFYRAMEPYLSLLKPGGLAAFEVGMGEDRDVSALLSSFGLSDVFVEKDFAGTGRVAGGFRA